MLDLTANQISEVDKEVFKDLLVLKYLSLRSNKLTLIKDGTFSTLRALEFLSLEDNTITAIHANAFKRLWQLSELRVHKNVIECKPSDERVRGAKISWFNACQCPSDEARAESGLKNVFYDEPTGLSGADDKCGSLVPVTKCPGNLNLKRCEDSSMNDPCLGTTGKCKFPVQLKETTVGCVLRAVCRVPCAVCHTTSCPTHGTHAGTQAATRACKCECWVLSGPCFPANQHACCRATLPRWGQPKIGKLPC